MGMLQVERTGEPHQAARRLMSGFNHGLGRLGLDQHGAAAGIICLAQLGDSEAAGRALDEPHPQPLLQHGDAATELGLGHAERPAGLGKAAVIHHLDVVIEIVEVLLHRLSFTK
ncbi:hypothetical protein D3C86_1656690 [compost metagenome]